MLRSSRLLAILATAVVVAACTGAGASPSPTAAPVSQASEAPTPAVTANACAPGSLKTLTAGSLTIGTDNPAYPPYFAQHDGPYPSPWEALGYTGDPTTGQGFESAVAFSIARRMGFANDKVSWVVVPFDNSYAPGAKTFDFDINQISYTADRAQNVDMSDSYYDLNQAVVALKANPVSKATSVADLKSYKFGAAVGTTSYQTIQTVIQPTADALVYNDNDGAINALKAKSIDAIVVDLPTADYITSVQIENGAATIVGQLAPASGTSDHFSLVLTKGSPLTSCVNAAIASLKADGTLAALATKWLPFQGDVPVLK